MWLFPKKLKDSELKELRQINTIINTERFKLIFIKNNTAAIPNAKDLITTSQTLIDQMEVYKNQWIGQVLVLGHGLDKGKSFEIREDGVIIERNIEKPEEIQAVREAKREVAMSEVKEETAK